MKIIKDQKGFSLLELLIVLGVLMILGTAVFYWVDPVAQVGKAEDKRRQNDILNIANAFTSYARDHKGALPILGQVNSSKKVLCSIQSGTQLTCGASTEYCLAISDQDFFDKYLGRLPTDPDKSSETDTGYYILADASNNIVFGSCSYSVAAVAYQARLVDACATYAGGYCWYGTEAWSESCDTVCAANNKVCPNGVNYKEDSLCILNDVFNDPYSCGECSVSADEYPPAWADDNICSYTTSTINCAQASGAIAICPCQ